jgi:hypothetical protein
VNFLRISCARRKAAPVAASEGASEIVFTPRGAIFWFAYAKKYSAHLTIAVLGRFRNADYHPDTLLLWRTKSDKPLSDCPHAPG